jgi:hypothetical protein
LISWKKNREFNHLINFKEVCPFFPDGLIEITEKPDFIVHTHDNLLGIEHTEIFQPGPTDGTSLQAQDSLGQRVVSKAKRLYLKQYSQPLFVQICFNNKAMISKKSVDRLAKAVVHLLEITHIEPGEAITLRRTIENSKDFPNEIIMLHIYAQHGKENRWVSSSAGWIPEVTPEYIQEKIDQKEKKLDYYKSKCAITWLLVVADNARIPSSVFVKRKGDHLLIEKGTTFAFSSAL